ncbi:MAG TPA: hypothetical protein VG406_04150 [Isosphaeraceae bacterium]|jgi:hypothetical protein|nr:hypothetical protein [Isosphaeraceae bacterium]
MSLAASVLAMALTLPAAEAGGRGEPAPKGGAIEAGGRGRFTIGVNFYLAGARFRVGGDWSPARPFFAEVPLDAVVAVTVVVVAPPPDAGRAVAASD